MRVGFRWKRGNLRLIECPLTERGGEPCCGDSHPRVVGSWVSDLASGSTQSLLQERRSDYERRRQDAVVEVLRMIKRPAGPPGRDLVTGVGSRREESYKDGCNVKGAQTQFRHAAAS